MGNKKPTYVDFDHKNYKWKPDIDYRENPHLYEIGRGQQGVLICEPYKSELYPLWKFKTPEIAQFSALQIINKFFQYLEEKDFVGADMAKKYLHMGFTRARRYANHRDGKKYKDGEVLPQEPDHATCDFAKSAKIFKKVRDIVAKNKTYVTMRKEWRSSE